MKARVVAGISLILLALLGCFYWLKPDFAAAVTIFPFWTWLPFGLLPLLGWKKLGRRGGWVLLFAWILGTVSFSEEWIGFLRIPTTGDPSREVVVVSLNCAGGLIEAAREVAQHHPDIVLLQESPGKNELEVLRQELFGKGGTVVSGPDAAVLSRYPLRAFEKPHIDATAAIATLDDGRSLNIVSLRLMPPVFRVDIFNPSAWSDLRRNRELRREELGEVADWVSKMPGNATIVGGDFNAQSGDAVFRGMPGGLRDAFYEGGIGWGHTAVNDYPLARIDQIWVSQEFYLLHERVQKTVYSDHRMVVLRMMLN
ncbi:MAG TPA: endonuclease/exonuclease/phosphatase family protein [Fimbriimonas sp.]|nr:endonuclease/exonuclease/phosphatase family protein [Fimbriimonas sp.]